MKDIVIRGKLTLKEILDNIEKVSGKPSGELEKLETNMRLATLLSVMAGDLEKYSDCMTDHAICWFIHGAIMAKIQPDIIEIVEKP